jgi:hypothetical protein
MSNVLADDVWVNLTSHRLNVTSTLTDIGDGVGALFTGIGAPLVIFIILLAVGSMIGYILMNVFKKDYLGGT